MHRLIMLVDSHTFLLLCRHWQQCGCIIRARGKLQQTYHLQLLRRSFGAWSSWSQASSRARRTRLQAALQGWRLVVASRRGLLEQWQGMRRLRHMGRVWSEWRHIVQTMVGLQSCWGCPGTRRCRLSFSLRVTCLKGVSSLISTIAFTVPAL